MLAFSECFQCQLSKVVAKTGVALLVLGKELPRGCESRNVAMSLDINSTLHTCRGCSDVEEGRKSNSQHLYLSPSLQRHTAGNRDNAMIYIMGQQQGKEAVTMNRLGEGRLKKGQEHRKRSQGRP